MAGPEKGEPCLNASGVDKATVHAAYILRQLQVNHDEKVARSIARGIIKIYLKAVRQDLKKNMRVNPLKFKFAEMSIGDFIDVEEIARQSLHAIFRAAKRYLKDDEARWQIGHCPQPGQIRIYRLGIDERPKRDPYRNAKAVALASIPIGQAKTLDFKLEQNIKVMARRIVDNNAANWRMRKTNKGYQIRRVL